MRTRRQKTKRGRRRKLFYKRRLHTRRRRRKRTTRKKRCRGGRALRGGQSTQLPITLLCDSADVAAAAACEVIGLGPEDPLADVCAYEMATHIAKWCKNFISKHEPGALKRFLDGPLFQIILEYLGKGKGKENSSALSSMTRSRSSRRRKQRR